MWNIPFCLSGYLRNIWCSNFLQKIAEPWPEQSVRNTCILSSAEIRFQPPGLVITERCGHSINEPNCILAPFNLCEYSCGRTSMKKKQHVSLLTVLPGLQDQQWRPHLCLHSISASVWLTKGILFFGLTPGHMQQHPLTQLVSTQGWL